MITFSKLGTYGRLGNQLFQYAAAKTAALNCSAVFAIPLENQNLDKIFNIECKKYSLFDNSSLIYKLNQYSETVFNYDTRFESIKDNTNIIGFFQSEKYFKKYEKNIRQEFTFKDEILNFCKKNIDEIKEKNNKDIVSLHVRRTDYVNLQNYHPLCSLEYYNNAIKMFDNAIFYVFSDDIDWCKEHLKNNNFIYSDGKTTAEDLCLMTLCDHNIIANSSYSWWGAWLNQNKNKKIIAPKDWFGPSYKDKNTSDIYPEEWLKL